VTVAACDSRDRERSASTGIMGATFSICILTFTRSAIHVVCAQ